MWINGDLDLAWASFGLVGGLVGCLGWLHRDLSRVVVVVG